MGITQSSCSSSIESKRKSRNGHRMKYEPRADPSSEEMLTFQSPTVQGCFGYREVERRDVLENLSLSIKARSELNEAAASCSKLSTSSEDFFRKLKTASALTAAPNKSVELLLGKRPRRITRQNSPAQTETTTTSQTDSMVSGDSRVVPGDGYLPPRTSTEMINNDNGCEPKCPMAGPSPTIPVRKPNHRTNSTSIHNYVEDNASPTTEYCSNKRHHVDAEGEEHLKRMYDMRTWDMYLRIIEARQKSHYVPQEQPQQQEDDQRNDQTTSKEEHATFRRLSSKLEDLSNSEYVISSSLSSTTGNGYEHDMIFGDLD